MNIAYLTQITNLKISDKNPVSYLKDYDVPEFTKILETHLMPSDLLEWAREDIAPENALDIFIENRIEKIINQLRTKLHGVNFEVIDTSVTDESN